MSDDFDAKLNKIVWRRPAPVPKRKKILFKKIWLGGGIFLVLLVMAGGLLFAPIFKVKKIYVSGTAGMNAVLVESFVRSYIASGSLAVGGDNILFINTKELEEKIKAEFPIAERVRIKKFFLKRAILTELTEKKSIGIWCGESNGVNSCFYLERGGTIFEEAPPVEGSLILLIKTRGLSEIPGLGAKVVEEFFLDFILKIKENPFFSANVGVKEFLLKSGSFDVQAVVTEGFRIIFDGKKNPDDQVANLKIVLEEKIKEERANLEYIDLREGDRIYYKLID